MINLYSHVGSIKPLANTVASNQTAFTGKIPTVSDMAEVSKSGNFSEYFGQLSQMFRRSSAGKAAAGKIETLLKSTNLDDQYKALKVLKAENGEPLFTLDELKRVMSVRRIDNVEITAKDVFAIATSGMSKQDALYTMGRIMTKDDLEVVRIMTRADGISVEGENVSRLQNRYKFSAFDIQDVRMLVMDSKDKPATLAFLKDLIDNNYRYSQFADLMVNMTSASPAKSDGDFLIKILRKFNTPKQRKTFINGLKNVG